MSLDAVTRSAGGAVPVGVAARGATTGIYLLRGIPRDLQTAARARAVTQGTTLRAVLLRAVREYADHTWTPRPDDASPESCGQQPR